MKKHTKFPSEIPLDSYEKELKEFLDRGVFENDSKEELDKLKKELVEAAKGYFEQKKTKSITIRVPHKDLLKVKAKAKGSGIPYQRIINMLIKDYAEDRTTITI